MRLLPLRPTIGKLTAVDPEEGLKTMLVGDD